MAGVKGRSGGARPNTGGKRPGAGRKPAAKKLLPAAEPVAQVEAPPAPDPNEPLPAILYSDPKDFLFAVMNDARTDEKLRVDAAKSLMPFVHGKIGEGGKKDAKTAAAKQVAGRFAAAAPPKLAAVGGKKL